MPYNANRRVGNLSATKLYTSSELAGCLNITRSYVTKLVADGVLKYASNAGGEVVHSRFHLKDAVRKYINYILTRVKQKPASAEAWDRARILKMNEEGRISTLRRLMMEGKIAVLRDVDQAVLTQIIATKSKLSGLPAQIIHLTEGIEDTHEKIRVANQLLEAALVDLAMPSHEEILSKNRQLSEFTDLQVDEHSEGSGDLTEQEPKRRPGKRKQQPEEVFT